MKKTLVVVVLVMLLSLVFVGGCTPKDFVVEATEKVDMGTIAKDYMYVLATEYPDRTTGEGKDLLAATFIAGQMKAQGYEGYKDENTKIPGFIELRTPEIGQSSKQVGYNVIFTKKAATESKGKIILSTQYDNVYSFPKNPRQADGSYESGASTAALLTIAKVLKDQNLPYDIEFIFYGGGAYNWNGAAYYAERTNISELNTILLSIDIGQIVGGDYTYAYTLDKETDYGNLVKKTISANNIQFTDVPQDKKVASAKLVENGLYSYFHVGMLNNNLFFMNKGVPTINILSHNWNDRTYPTRVEMKGKQNLYETPADTFTNMVKRVGEEKMAATLNDVVNFVNALVGESGQEQLLVALSTAKDQMPNKMAQSDMTNTVLSMSLKILPVIALVVILIQMRKIVNNKKDYYTQMLNRPKNVVNEKPIDVFGWDEKDDKGQEDGEIIEGEVIKPKDDDNDDIFSDL